MIIEERLKIANKVLEVLCDEYKTENDKGVKPKPMTFSVNKNRLYFDFQTYHGKNFSKPWATRNSSCYPSWEGELCVGGTMITAIAQLANWIRDRPCTSLRWWKYITSKNIGMRGGDQIIPILADSDYPKQSICHFCGKVDGNFDWYWFSIKDSGYGCIHPECEPLKACRNHHIAKEKTQKWRKSDV